MLQYFMQRCSISRSIIWQDEVAKSSQKMLHETSISLHVIPIRYNKQISLKLHMLQHFMQRCSSDDGFACRKNCVGD